MIPADAIAPTAQRLPSVDVARTIAIIGMVIFHFARDLEIFGLLPYGTTLFGPWAWFARGVAGTFLFLAGVSLWLAHGDGIRWPAFWRRFGILSLAALAVTTATFIAMRDQFVYFGILHSIAACSLIALAFLRLPAALTAACAVAIWAIAAFSPDIFFTQWAAPIGLSAEVRGSMDLVPLIPWLAPCLLGLAFARAFAHRLPRAAPSRAMTLLAWPGRHSLVIYLVHQPILMAAIWSVLQITR